MTGMIRSFFAHVLPQVMRPLRILWNEMIGLLFLVISVPFIWSAVKSFRKIDQGGDNLWGALLSVAFGAVMLFCGIHSFMRARRISRP
jgi:threonine/homoserine/homoserine lactone efflux protein